MSMENAILAHGEALRELAAAIKMMYAGKADALSAGGARVELGGGARGTTAEDAAADFIPGKKNKYGDTELEQAVESVKKVVDAKKPAAGATESTTGSAPADEAEAKSTERKAMDAVVDANKKAADAAEKARIDADTKAADTKAAEADRTEVHMDTPLDYAKDVRPVLLAAIKAGKRAEIEAHLASAGVTKADLLKPEQLPATLKLAQKLVA